MSQLRLITARINIEIFEDLINESQKFNLKFSEVLRRRLQNKIQLNGVKYGAGKG